MGQGCFASSKVVKKSSGLQKIDKPTSLQLVGFLFFGIVTLPGHEINLQSKRYSAY